MVINKSRLLELSPIKNMLGTKEKHNGCSHGLSEAGYDIRIKQTVHFSHGMVSCHAPDEHHPLFVPKWHEGKFVLASAIEEFDMPNNLVGIVHDKSTWA
mgnify:CR=1 FL=1